MDLDRENCSFTPPWTTIAEALEKRGLLEPIAAIALNGHSTMYEICGRTHLSMAVKARHAAWRYLRKLGFSYPEIGRLWNVNQASVRKALRKKGQS